MTDTSQAPKSDANECDKADAFAEIVAHRRSIRKYKDKPVSDEDLQFCLDQALLSPNSSNLQPWEFWVIRSPELREQLIPACMGQNAAKTAPEMIAVVGRRNTWKQVAQQILDDFPGGEPPEIVKKYYSKQAKFMYEPGPAGLFGLAKKMYLTAKGLQKPVMREPLTRAQQKEWITKTCSLAAQTFMLAASSLGLDTCPMEGFDSKRVRAILGIPPDGWVVMLIALGYRSDKGVYGDRYRVPKSQVVKYL